MRNIQVDANGQMHCWHCGGVNFTHKRTFRSKAAVGVGALLTKKKMKCLQCGTYNDVGNADPYVDPAARVPQASMQEKPKSAFQIGYEQSMARSREKMAEKARRDSTKHRPANSRKTKHTPMGWYSDPGGAQGVLRYWDGDQWTEHTAADPNISN